MSIPQQLARFATGFLTLAFAIGISTPALAFRLEVPKTLVQKVDSLKQLAQEGAAPSAPSSPAQFGPIPSGAPNGPVSGSTQFSPPPGESTGQFQPMMGQQQFNPGSNQVGPNQGQFGSGFNQMAPNNQFGGNQGQNQGQMGQSQNQQQQQQQVRDIQNQAKQMENNVKRFEGMYKGQQMPQEVKDKLEQVKGNINNLKNAKSSEDVQNIDMGQMQQDMQSLDQGRQQQQQEQQQLSGMKRGLQGAVQGLKQFESQLTRLTKQGITVPKEITNTIASIKTKFDAIKAAKTFDDAQTAGIESLGDDMNSLNDFRQQLEMLARWPQTLKQVNQQLKNLDSQVKKSQTIVAKLAKQGIDLADEQTAFVEAVNKLKSARDQAAAKVKEGTTDSIQEAFDLLENDLFGQMDDTMQNLNVIMTMSNLGRFTSDFKRNIAQAQQQINQLKRKKIDTAELEDLLSQAKTKGNEVLSLLKAKPVDTDAIQADLQELESLRNDFGDKMDELTGGTGSAPLPWEQGPKQFTAPNTGFDSLQQFLPQKSVETTPSSGQTCNINGVEVPGPCDNSAAAQ